VRSRTGNASEPASVSHRAARPLAAATALTLAMALGCATPLFGGGAGRLVEEGKAAVDRQDLPAAYELFKQVQLEHPDSAENQEAWHYAVAIFQRKYQANRHDNRSSPWVAQEPEFLYGWLGHRLDRGDGARAARILFMGMPWSFYQGYLRYAEAHPELAGWRVVAEEDNGIIEKVELETS